MQPTNRSVQKGYPLSALFVLLAVCAVVSALLAPVANAIVTKELTVFYVAIASLIGAGVVGLLGGAVGLYHYRPLRGAGWGLLTGVIAGLFIGPLMLVPPEAVGPLITMSIGGSIVLLITGAAFGFGARN